MRISDWSSDVCSSDLYKLNIPIARIDDIFQELFKLEIEKNKNEIAILMRIVLEMTVDEYLDEKKISRKRGNPHYQKDKFLVEKVDEIGSASSRERGSQEG